MFDAQVAPLFDLSVVLVAGLACFYLWWLLAHATILEWAFAYPREHWDKLWLCPYCAGFWITGVVLYVAGVYDPLTHLATAGFVGVVGGSIT